MLLSLFHTTFNSSNRNITETIMRLWKEPERRSVNVQCARRGFDVDACSSVGSKDRALTLTVAVNDIPVGRLCVDHRSRSETARAAMC